jgi:hypothetical protein
MPVTRLWHTNPSLLAVNATDTSKLATLLSLQIKPVYISSYCTFLVTVPFWLLYISGYCTFLWLKNILQGQEVVEDGWTLKILRTSETYSCIERLSDVQLFYGNKI